MENKKMEKVKPSPKMLLESASFIDELNKLCDLYEQKHLIKLPKRAMCMICIKHGMKEMFNKLGE